MNLPEINKICWIASYPKSGNTWVRMFLEAYIRGDLDINSRTKITKSDTVKMDYQQVMNRRFDELPEQAILQYRSAALANSMFMINPQQPYFKTHNAQISVHGVPLIPSAISRSALYIVRDPREIVPSYAAHMGRNLDYAVYQLTTYDSVLSDDGHMRHYVGAWDKHVQSWEKGVPTCRIRYEDLRDDSERGFEVVLEFFKIKYNYRRMMKSLRLTDLERLKKQEQKNGFIEKLPHESTEFFGGEREKLTSKQKLKIELDLGPMMTQLGYKLNEVNKDGSNVKIKQLPPAAIRGES